MGKHKLSAGYIDFDLVKVNLEKVFFFFFFISIKITQNDKTIGFMLKILKLMIFFYFFFCPNRLSITNCKKKFIFKSLNTEIADDIKE